MNNKGGAQPAHPRSLISTFVVRCLDSITSLVSISEISSLQLVSIAEQAGLSFTWSETLNTGFLMTRLYYKYRNMCQTFSVYGDDCFLKGWTLSFLFILWWMLTNLDLVVPKILFYKRVIWFKTFYDKIKPLIESKDSKIYFCNKFIICRLNMYLKVLLYYLRSNSLCEILGFIIKICCFPLIKAMCSFNSKLTLSPCFPSNINW